MSFSAQSIPKSALGYHRVLAPTAGVRVSPLCLGTMNFGEAWKGMMGGIENCCASEGLGH